MVKIRWELSNELYNNTLRWSMETPKQNKKALFYPQSDPAYGGASTIELTTSTQHVFIHQCVVVR